MTQEERINKATALIATAEKRLAEAQAELEEARKEPKPKLIGVPLREAPEEGAKYWCIQGDGDGSARERWYSDDYALGALAFGNVFATKEDAEFAAERRRIFAHPIGEWEPERHAWFWDWEYKMVKTSIPADTSPNSYRLWLNGELAFGDDGKAELERRVTAWKELCEEYGL